MKTISGACSRWLLETKVEGVVYPFLGSFGQRKTGQEIADMVFGAFVVILRVRSMQSEFGSE